MTIAMEFSGKVPTFTVGDRLRKAREDAGMTAVEFAKATDIARKTIYNYENEVTPPRRLTMRMWALATGVDSHWLEHGHTITPNDGPCRVCAIRDSNPEPADNLPRLVSVAA